MREGGRRAESGEGENYGAKEGEEVGDARRLMKFRWVKDAVRGGQEGGK